MHEEVSTVGEKEWYFFCIRERKYRNSLRPNRVTRSGFWKATGIDKPIYATEETTHQCIGLKKSLVYYCGSAGKGSKTDWMMHEFRLPPCWKNTSQQNAQGKNISPEAEVWTLCRIIKRNAPYKKYIDPDRKQTTSRQSLNDASSITCSLESDNSMNSRDLLFQQNEKKLIINCAGEGNQLFPNQQNLIAQTPFAISHLSFWDPNSEELFRDGNWDELRTVVEGG